MIDQQGVTIEKQLPGAIVLKGDTALLKIAYRNLLDNALKYGNKGGKNTTLAVRRKTEVFTSRCGTKGKG